MDHDTSITPTCDDDYRRAVERAGVIELPDDGEPAPSSSRLADLLSGRFEDDEPPGAPR